MPGYKIQSVDIAAHMRRLLPYSNGNYIKFQTKVKVSKLFSGFGIIYILVNRIIERRNSSVHMETTEKPFIKFIFLIDIIINQNMLYKYDFQII